MTISHPWSLTEGLAQLDLKPFHATFDRFDPSKGLFDIHASEPMPKPVGLLGLHRPTDEPVEDSLTECYVRGSDLVAVYRESARWPIQVDAAWRVVSEPGCERVLAAVDLVLSVTTELLDARPAMEVVSRFSATEVLRLADPRTGRFEECHGEETKAYTPEEGPGCFLFRFASIGYTYVEMILPNDFIQSDATRTTGVRHRIFPDRIEKGLILRARLRGLWVHRSEDTQSAAACYSAFAMAELPLGT